MEREGYDDSFRNESVDKEILSQIDKEFKSLPSHRNSQTNFLTSSPPQNWTLIMKENQHFNAITAENQLKAKKLDSLKSILLVLESESIHSHCRSPPNYSITISESHKKISELQATYSQTLQRTEEENSEAYKLQNSKENIKKSIAIMKERIDQLKDVYTKLNEKQHKFELAKFHAMSLCTYAKETKIKYKQENNKLSDYYQSCLYSCMTERKSAQDTLKNTIQKFSLLTRRNQDIQSHREEILNLIKNEMQECSRTKELQSLYRQTLAVYDRQFKELENMIEVRLDVDISKPVPKDLAEKVIHEFNLVQFTQLSLSSQYEDLVTKLQAHYISVRDLSALLRAYRPDEDEENAGSPKHRTTLNLYKETLDTAHTNNRHQEIERLLIVIFVSAKHLAGKLLNPLLHMKEMGMTLPHKLEHFYTTLYETLKYLTPEYTSNTGNNSPSTAKLPALTSFRNFTTKELSHKLSKSDSHSNFKVLRKEVSELFYSIHPESKENAERFGRLLQTIPCVKYVFDMRQVKHYLINQSADEAFTNVVVLINKAKKEIHDRLTSVLNDLKCMILCIRNCNEEGEKELETVYKDKLPNQLDFIKDKISEPWLKKKNWRLPEREAKIPSDLYRIKEPLDSGHLSDRYSSISRSTHCSQSSYNPNPEKLSLVQTTLQDMLNFESKLKELRNTERSARDVELSVPAICLPSIAIKYSFPQAKQSTRIPSSSASRLDTSKFSNSKPISVELAKRARTAN
jgi:hypothetical protein